MVTTANSPADHRPQRAFKHPWRVVVVAAVLLGVMNLGVWLLSESDTTSVTPVLSDEGAQFPAAIDDVTPFPGELLSPQDTIGADLRNDYTGVLILDPPSTAAFEIPEDQLDRVVNLGQVSFRPGDDKELTRFEPGVYSVVVEFWPQTDERPARPESYSWRFRVGA